MTPLKSQTVYIPTKNTTNTFLSIRRGVNVLYQSDVIKKQNQILLSKEQLIELSKSIWDAAIEYRADVGKCQGKLDLCTKPSFRQFINNILSE